MRGHQRQEADDGEVYNDMIQESLKNQNTGRKTQQLFLVDSEGGRYLAVVGEEKKDGRGGHYLYRSVEPFETYRSFRGSNATGAKKYLSEMINNPTAFRGTHELATQIRDMGGEEEYLKRKEGDKPEGGPGAAQQQEEGTGPQAPSPAAAAAAAAPSPAPAAEPPQPSGAPPPPPEGPSGKPPGEGRGARAKKEPSPEATASPAPRETAPTPAPAAGPSPAPAAPATVLGPPVPPLPNMAPLGGAGHASGLPPAPLLRPSAPDAVSFIPLEAPPSAAAPPGGFGLGRAHPPDEFKPLMQIIAPPAGGGRGGPGKRGGGRRGRGGGRGGGGDPVTPMPTPEGGVFGAAPMSPGRNLLARNPATHPGQPGQSEAPASTPGNPAFPGLMEGGRPPTLDQLAPLTHHHLPPLPPTAIFTGTGPSGLPIFAQAPHAPHPSAAPLLSDNPLGGGGEGGARGPGSGRGRKRKDLDFKKHGKPGRPRKSRLGEAVPGIFGEGAAAGGAPAAPGPGAGAAPRPGEYSLPNELRRAAEEELMRRGGAKRTAVAWAQATGRAGQGPTLTRDEEATWQTLRDARAAVERFLEAHEGGAGLGPDGPVSPQGGALSKKSPNARSTARRRRSAALSPVLEGLGAHQAGAAAPSIDELISSLRQLTSVPWGLRTWAALDIGGGLDRLSDLVRHVQSGGAKAADALGLPPGSWPQAVLTIVESVRQQWRGMVRERLFVLSDPRMVQDPAARLETLLLHTVTVSEDRNAKKPVGR